MTAEIIDGKVYATRIRGRACRQSAVLAAQHGLVPGLTVVLVGEDPASQVYVRNKGKAANEANFRSEEICLPADTSEADVLAAVARLNADPTVHGILVQLPLPDHIDAQKVTESIDPAKDVDGLHVVNIGRLASGLDGMVPCTPLGCLKVLQDRFPGGMAGLNAVVVGRSNLVGKPMAQLLLKENCTVTIAHSRTRDLPGLCRTADILVAAVGRPAMIGGDWIKPGATVLDVGINRVDAGAGKTRLVGDVDFKAASAVAGAITPVPGGVGLLTVSCLLANTITAACRQAGIAEPEVD